MKTRKNLPHFSSDYSKFLIQLPLSWQEVDRKNFVSLCRILAHQDITDSSAPLFFLAVTGLTPISAMGNYSIFETRDKKIVQLDNSQLAVAVEKLAWIDKPNDSLYKNHEITQYMAHLGCTDILKWPFAKFLAVDALFSASLGTSDHAVKSQSKFALEMLRDENSKLKISKSILLRLYSPQRIALFLYFSAFKDFIAKRFTHLFAPQNDSAIALPSDSSVADSINAQIRALTKGDVTAEEKVLAIQTGRALTELNELAREYKEFKQMEQKHK